MTPLDYIRNAKALMAEGADPDHPEQDLITATCRDFDETDLGNADRLMAWYGDFIRYTEEAGWVAYDGRKWDATGGQKVVHRMANDVVRKIRDEANFFDGDTGRWAKRMQHFTKSSKTSNVKAMMEAAAPSLTGSLDDFDTDAHLFAVENGVIDLTTGELLPHDPEHMITRIAGIVFDENATSDDWDQFIIDITCGDPVLARFLQIAVGYSLFASQKEQLAFFITGDEKNQDKNGSNGKSLFLSILSALFGEYHKTVDRKMVISKADGGIPNDIAALKGARLACGSEFKKTDVIAPETFKKLTGDEKVEARFLRREFFEFDNLATFWYATNYLPLVPDQDDGVWRRMVIIPFLAKFYEARSCPPGGKVKDTGLKDRLMQQLPGILNWALEGAREYAENGLTVPEHLFQVKDDRKTDFDPMASFLDICVEREDDALIAAADLRKAYESFCESQGEDTISKTAFGRRLEQMGIEKDAAASKARGLVFRAGATLTEAGQAYRDGDIATVKSWLKLADGPFQYRLGNSGMTKTASGLSELPEDVRRVVAPNGMLPKLNMKMQTSAGWFERVA